MTIYNIELFEESKQLEINEIFEDYKKMKNFIKEMRKIQIYKKENKIKLNIVMKYMDKDMCQFYMNLNVQYSTIILRNDYEIFGCLNKELINQKYIKNRSFQNIRCFDISKFLELKKKLKLMIKYKINNIEVLTQQQAFDLGMQI
jgi:hypothetical protein